MDEPEDLMELWWETMELDALVANSCPQIGPSVSEPPRMLSPVPSSELFAKKSDKPKTRKKAPPEQMNKSLFYLIRNNIRTMKRVRRTHDKFLAFNLASEEGSDKAIPPEVPKPMAEEEGRVTMMATVRPWRPKVVGVEANSHEAEDCLHWLGPKILEHAGFQGQNSSNELSQMD